MKSKTPKHRSIKIKEEPKNVKSCDVFLFQSTPENKATVTKVIERCNWKTVDDDNGNSTISVIEEKEDVELISFSNVASSNDTRPCHILIISDSSINCRHLSYLLTSFFNECQLLCTFDVCSEYNVFIKMMSRWSYDIFFLTRDTVEHPKFPTIYQNSPSHNSPIIVYKYYSTLSYNEQ